MTHVVRCSSILFLPSPFSCNSCLSWLAILLFFAASTTSSFAADTDQLAFFENNIRPLLIERCIKCHGPKKAESGLRLDTIATVLKGGDSGPAVIPGQPDDSLIIKAVRHQDDLQMPPDDKLDDREIAAIARWIQGGAVWPAGMMLGGGGPSVRGGPITDEERGFWSFQTIADPQPPPVEAVAAEPSPPTGRASQPGQIRNDIDRFVMAKLREAGLKPMRPADKRLLLRRATFDLTGLPPTPQHIQAFLADDSPAAFETAVDRLLRTQAYGERWGRHWLDVVRYADTAGETGDYPTPLSYKYRNWVINAFNADKPYDQFVREQIAGDILGERMINRLTANRRRVRGEDEAEAHASALRFNDEERERYKEMLTATGFIAISRRFGFDVENYHHLTIQDTIDTVGQAFLGLSLGCARCHDHKYDPVNTADYYAWYGIFDSTRYSFPGSEEKKRPYDSFPVLPPTEAKQIKLAFDASLAKTDARIQELEEAKKALALKLAAGANSSGFAGFELQPLGQSPIAPLGILGEVAAAESAQSPYENVFPVGTRGLAMPGTPNNDAFGQPIAPAHTSSLTPRLYYNIDFRHVSANGNANGAYRFYLGRGPGNSAAVEMGASATKFYVKNGASYEIIRELELGKWYSLQLTLDLRAKRFSGTIGVPGDLTKFESKSFTDGWDGTIDRTFVDRYGPAGGVTPARELDNLAVSTSPFLPPGESIRDHAQRQASARWKTLIEQRRLIHRGENRDGHPGFHVWHGDALPVVGVNTSGEIRKVPGTVPPGKLVVHPAEKDGAGLAWRSPLAGKVKITGTVQDAHDCGDSIAWFIDRLGAEGLQAVASGATEQNGSQTIQVPEVTVQPGDFLQLAIMPKQHYGCDLTQIELTIEEVGGKRTWNLLEDVVGDFLESNPQDDGFENPETWLFYRVATDRGAEFGESLLSDSNSHDLLALREQSEKLNAELGELSSRRDELQATGPYEVVYAAIEKDETKDAQIRIRGNRRNLGDEVPRKNLDILGGDPLPAAAGSGRLELANWLTREENPLLARVMVNRVWQHHFGRGLVGTENDFGARGERPTHPELLDWLATRFQESGYSIKSLHRLIMASAAYQRSSDYDARAADVDPDARLLWRQNRRRLSAEEIRDAMLFVSGGLDPSMGGEHPFPAVDTWGFTQHAPYYGVYPTNRRSVYLMQQRLKRHPFLALFDGADPNVSTARRELTTVPTQSLYLMNSEFIHVQAAGLAKRVMSDASDAAARVGLMFQVAIARRPSEDELADALQFLSSYIEALATSETAQEDRQLAAWSGLARTMLTRNDFLFVD